jgi:hypothetical protein
METLKTVFAEAQKHNRVCPQPKQWQKLYEMLPNKKRKGRGWEPPLPLILAAWWDTPDTLKMERLRIHIEWAEAHECLEKVSGFLSGLSEEQWHHIDD